MSEIQGKEQMLGISKKQGKATYKDYKISSLSAIDGDIVKFGPASHRRSTRNKIVWRGISRRKA